MYHSYKITENIERQHIPTYAGSVKFSYIKEIFLNLVSF